jgi:gamma-glutamyltranspeptidase/glutathione hydrolase
MVIPGLADTLQLVADEGARTMYDGALAEAVVADMAERGGQVTRQDLAGYRPTVRTALAFGCGAWSVRTNPPPAIGGPVLAAMLTLLGERPRGPWTEDDVAALVAVQHAVLGHRATTLDVASDREAAGLALLDAVGRGAFAAAMGSPSTVQVSVVDGSGGACSITASSGYGSGATVPGTGLWLNNCLGEHELNRGETLSPGARLASNMAPTVARDRDGAVLAIGSPGADRITTALAQVLAAFAHGRATLQEAIDRPRLHLGVDEHGHPAVLHAESDLPLPDLGLPVRTHEPHSMFFGGVAAALRGGDGALAAAGDPRRAGATAVSAG